MTGLMSTFRTRLRQRAAYARTIAALRNMPLDVAHDLDIDPQSEARPLAARAVYGR